MKKLMSLIVGVMLISFAHAASAEDAIKIETGKAAPAIKMQTQHGADWELKDFRGKPVVIVYTGRKGFNDASTIVNEIKSRYDVKGDKARVEAVGAAYLKGVPGFIKGTIKKSMKKPENPPFLMDWKGEIAKAYGYAEKGIIAFIIDAKGIVRFASPVANSEKDKNRIFAALDSMLAEK